MNSSVRELTSSDVYCKEIILHIYRENYRWRRKEVLVQREGCCGYCHNFFTFNSLCKGLEQIRLLFRKVDERDQRFQSLSPDV